MRGGRCWCAFLSVLLTLSAWMSGQTEGGKLKGNQVLPAQVQNGRVIVPDLSAVMRSLGDEVPSQPTSPPGRWPQIVRPPAAASGMIRFPVLVKAAGTIFSGTVTSIERRPATPAHAIETVAITFQVQQSIRGVVPGEDFTLLQWMGLWSSGQRYRVGERVLLFLYPASKLGLTSCVGSETGRFAIDSTGHVLLSAHHLAAFRQDPVLGGRSRARFSDFALAVRRASEEEWAP